MTKKPLKEYCGEIEDLLYECTNKNRVSDVTIDDVYDLFRLKNTFDKVLERVGAPFDIARKQNVSWVVETYYNYVFIWHKKTIELITYTFIKVNEHGGDVWYEIPSGEKSHDPCKYYSKTPETALAKLKRSVEADKTFAYKKLKQIKALEKQYDIKPSKARKKELKNRYKKYARAMEVLKGWE